MMKSNVNGKKSSNALRIRIFVSVLYVCWTIANSAYFVEGATDTHGNSSDVQLHEENCTSPAIEEFPRDLFTPKQRKNGAIVVHILVAAYLIWCLGIICDDFFVPVLEILCETLSLAPDVAGATFMAAGTSSPEFFANVMGTFVTKSDLGIGTIVGSAVFNIFGIIAVCGLFSGKKVRLDWYPITRDCIYYALTILTLILVLIDESVFWYESLIMITIYIGYILIMVFNWRIEKWAHKLQKKLRTKIFPRVPTETTPLHFHDQRHHHHHHHHHDQEQDHQNHSMATTANQNENGDILEIEQEVTFAPDQTDKAQKVRLSISTEILGQNGANGPSDDTDTGSGDYDEEIRYPWQPPYNANCFGLLVWLLFFPMNLALFVTVPDVRRGGLFTRLYPISFIMCMVWIGGLSYVITWMITVIGFTWNIPDSVMGLTFLAVGTSIPEVISSLIVSRQGYGSMAVSNSIGSNTFDILLCLGFPWFCKSIIQGATSDEPWSVTVKSEGLSYTVINLMILLVSRFILSRTLGIACALIYAAFLSIAILFELNVFFEVNLPTCPSEY